MADYFPLISKAVSGLAKNDSENRQALYGRARVALVDQLREITPPLTGTQLIHEQVKLEEAIRKVESQHKAASNEQAQTITPTVKTATITPIAPMPKLFPKTAK